VIQLLFSVLGKVLELERQGVGSKPTTASIFRAPCDAGQGFSTRIVTDRFAVLARTSFDGAQQALHLHQFKWPTLRAASLEKFSLDYGISNLIATFQMLSHHVSFYQGPVFSSGGFGLPLCSSLCASGFFVLFLGSVSLRFHVQHAS
jgi:hypothetical protein